jgi:parvulin-like peptidyl-prolyl isomerase
MNLKRFVLLQYPFLFTFILCTSTSAIAQEIAPQKTGKVAATVNGVEITTDQIERDLKRTLKDIKLTHSQSILAKKASLRKLVNQRVAFSYLEKHNAAAGETEVHLLIAELKTELATVEKELDDYLEETNQTLAEFEFQTAWNTSWKRYLNRKLTDAVLEKHFNENKRQFDGTKLRVAHLLSKFPQNANEIQRIEVRKKMEAIAKTMSESSRSFESFATEYSEAPTKKDGGEIGWIGLNGPMPKSFTDEAFKLEQRDVSGPVTTKFGVHLILCMEVKEGELTWLDVKDLVRASASKAYFEAIIKKHTPEVEIKFAD